MRAPHKSANAIFAAMLFASITLFATSAFAGTPTNVLFGGPNYPLCGGSPYNIKIAVGDCIKLFQPLNPSKPYGGDATIGTLTLAGGTITACGVAPGTTTWYFDIDSFDNHHEPIRCTVQVNLIVY